MDELADVPETHDDDEPEPNNEVKDLAFIGYTFKKFDYLTRKKAI